MTRPATIRRRALAELVAALFLVCAGGVVLSYWMIGDQSFPGGKDHDFGPYQVDANLLQALGVVAVLGSAYGLITVVCRVWRRAYSTAWVFVALALIAAGAATGYFWRQATAAVDGANIGAGMLFILAAFVWSIAAAVLIVAVGLQFRLSHRQASPRSGAAK